MNELDRTKEKLRIVLDALVDFNLRDLKFLREIHNTVSDNGQITREEFHGRLDPFLDTVQDEFAELQRKIKDVDDAA